MPDLNDFTRLGGTTYGPAIYKVVAEFLDHCRTVQADEYRVLEALSDLSVHLDNPQFHGLQCNRDSDDIHVYTDWVDWGHEDPQYDSPERVWVSCEGCGKLLAEVLL